MLAPENTWTDTAPNIHQQHWPGIDQDTVMSHKLNMAAFGLVLMVALTACSTSAPLPDAKATVTGITEGRGGDKTYLLRTAAGRTYIVTQALSVPPKIGDVVDIESSTTPGAARIKVR
jgi:hypothetical protein